MNSELSDLYTPRELAEQRIAFLERVLDYFTEITEITERAQIVGHKLRGTGGTLGLSGLSKLGTQLQQDALHEPDPDHLSQELQRIKPAIEAAIHDAIGIWFDGIPLTPDKVVAKLREAGLGTG